VRQELTQFFTSGSSRIEAGGGTIEVVPAWRFLLNLPESTE
jgi:hypothetical protein